MLKAHYHAENPQMTAIDMMRLWNTEPLNPTDAPIEPHGLIVQRLTPKKLSY
jgi:hypothetical protein